MRSDYLYTSTWREKNGSSTQAHQEDELCNKRTDYLSRQQIPYSVSNGLSRYHTNMTMSCTRILLWATRTRGISAHIANVIKIMTITKHALWLYFGYKLLLIIFIVRLMWLKINSCIDMTVLLCVHKIMRWWDRSNTLCWLIADNNNTALDKLSCCVYDVEAALCISREFIWGQDRSW